MAGTGDGGQNKGERSTKEFDDGSWVIQWQNYGVCNDVRKKICNQ